MFGHDRPGVARDDSRARVRAVALQLVIAIRLSGTRMT